MSTVASLIEKLQRNYKPCQTLAVVIWSVEDVKCKAEQMGIDISKSDAEYVLEELERDHDADQGINWEIIEETIIRLKTGDRDNPSS